MPDFSIEQKIEGLVIGLDEVGRGPLAGPVISCGCSFKDYTERDEYSKFILDSKKLSPKKREESFKYLQSLKKESMIDNIYSIYNKMHLTKKELRMLWGMHKKLKNLPKL